MHCGDFEVQFYNIESREGIYKGTLSSWGLVALSICVVCCLWTLAMCRILARVVSSILSFRYMSMHIGFVFVSFLEISRACFLMATGLLVYMSLMSNIINGLIGLVFSVASYRAIFSGFFHVAS